MHNHATLLISATSLLTLVYYLLAIGHWLLAICILLFLASLSFLISLARAAAREAYDETHAAEEDSGNDESYFSQTSHPSP
jgi:predicted tellurium resistance membrane protein TerC